MKSENLHVPPLPEANATDREISHLRDLSPQQMEVRYCGLAGMDFRWLRASSLYTGGPPVCGATAGVVGYDRPASGTIWFDHSSWVFGGLGPGRRFLWTNWRQLGREPGVVSDGADLRNLHRVWQCSRRHGGICSFSVYRGAGNRWRMGSRSVITFETWPKNGAHGSRGLQSGVNIGILMACGASYLMSSKSPRYIFGGSHSCIAGILDSTRGTGDRGMACREKECAGKGAGHSGFVWTGRMENYLGTLCLCDFPFRTLGVHVLASATFAESARCAA